MSLRKALDKAQQERLEAAGTGEFDQAGESKGTPRNGKQWQAPVYSESAPVELDPTTLMANKCVCITPGSPEIDRYKVIRAQIVQKTREKGWNTFMVTSAHPGEGKTLTAINLALTLAKEYNQTVLLVDCDMHKQDVHKRFGYASQRGLADYLIDDHSLNEIITWPGIEKMTLISGGQTIENAAELLGSPQMGRLVAEMKERYADRYVIFDVPSMLGGADAISFAQHVDGILMVVQAGRSSDKDLARAMSLLPQEKLLGFVLNRLP